MEASSKRNAYNRNNNEGSSGGAHRSAYTMCHRRVPFLQVTLTAWAQGDVAQREVLQEMFGLLREHFENQCTAFVHNAGLLAGFSSMSEFEGAPTLERTDTEKLLNPLDAELDRYERNLARSPDCTAWTGGSTRMFGLM